MTQARRAATLPVAFFRRPTEVVAQDLLGMVVVSTVGDELTAARIVETEAYLGYDDPASHGYRHRRNARNQALFGPPGSWYVYLSYGMHWCANLVCQRTGLASAVLLRALEPLDGLDVMRRRRGPVPDRELCSGPGKLCQALGISRHLDGRRIAESQVVVNRPRSEEENTIAVTSRIGITKAADWPLRFVVAGSPWLSRKTTGGGSQ
ncbi:MAG: DNA-3-methyladenine glycosylase [Gemmatimonadales bacterium]|jgi:DNA-3-methyladenine glycosylase|nr:DNA-3-methyladenine glycosylase [Gemmatimonadales bacterium]